jgi:uncharacterized damage-inducible protein DinB
MGEGMSWRAIVVLSEFVSHWNAVRAGLLMTARKFSDADIEYVPFPNGYSVAQLLLHIAHEEEIEVRYGITRELSDAPPAFAAEEYDTLEKIERELSETHARTQAYLETLSDADMEREIVAPWGARDTLSNFLWHVLEHEIHHRGELSLMLGLLGKEGLDA